MRLYNTLSRKIDEFKSIKDKNVGLYTCGPTVYDFAHIGNLRTYLFEDVLRRALEFEGYEINHVMNITDVGHLTSDEDTGEDKIEKGAEREHKSAYDVARFYENAFKSDMKLLNIETPKILPRATEHITEQIDLIKILEQKGYTYKTSDGIYMDTSKVEEYGKLARLNIEGQQEGARVEKNPEKKNSSDFALWKFSPRDAKREMEWSSPWGVGFPGWHIECSAMSVKYLGQPFDIHTGGVDHIPVHHTNEIAQSESALGKPLANYWLHSEFLKVDGGKMSKSLHNIYTLSDLKEKGFDPLDFRYLCLQAHYRSKLNFTWEALEAAKNARARLKNLISLIRHSRPDRESTVVDPRVKPEDDMLGGKYLDKFKASAYDDLNMPEALAVVWEMMRDTSVDDSAKYSSLMKMDEILGLDLDRELISDIPENIKSLVSEREKARAGKDWAKSDQIRKEIEKLGYSVEDTANGSKIEKN